MKGAYECDQCWKTYNTEDQLQRHIRKIHVGPRWRCPDCDYSADYSDRPGLRRHLQLDHHYTKDRAMDMQFEQVKPRKRGSHNVAGGGGSYNGGGGSYSSKRGRSPNENPPRWSEHDRGKNRSESLSPRHSIVSDATTTMTTEDQQSHTLRSVVSAVPSSTQTPTAAAAASMQTPSIIPKTLPYPSQVSSRAQESVQNASGGIRAVWSGTVPPGASITHLGVPQPVIERHFIQAPDDTILVKEVFLFQAPPHWTTFQDSTFEIITPTASASTTLNGGSGEAHGHHDKRESRSEAHRHRSHNSEERRHNHRNNHRENNRSSSHENHEEEEDDDNNHDHQETSSTSGSGSSLNGDRVLNGNDHKDLNGETDEMEETASLKEDKMVDDIIITVNGQENEEL